MDITRLRRTVSLVASAALVTALTVGAYTAPVAAAPDAQQQAAKEARAEARAEAKAAREAAKEARAEARAAAKAARKAAKEARAQARAEAKAARKAAKLDGSERTTVCHKPESPAEGTLEISVSALPAHLGHGDSEGECGSTASATLTTCEEPGASDAETSQDGTVDDEGVACDQPQDVVVSIDAPDEISSQDLLELAGAVSGLEADDLSYAWSSTCLTDEQLTDPAFIASEPGTVVLVIREDTLPPGTACGFTLTVTDEAAEAVGSATVTVQVLALT